MGTQQFCLKWNNHHSNMLVVFEQLLSSEALVDVTLACEGLSLKAHKMVLSACSPFFQSLFLENPCKHPIVILKDMRYTDLKAIIDFMYRGEVNVSQDQLSALLKTAETLKVKGLAEVTGDNRQGNGSGIVQQEIVQHNSTPQSSVPASGATTQHRAESPPLSRRKRGRPRRRSLSDSNRSDSEDQIPSKIKEPDSPEIIEDVNNDLTSDGVDVRQRLVSVPPLNQQSQVSSPNVPHLPPIASHKPHPALPSIHTQDARNVNMDENPSGDEADFEVDASKLMEQTMTTENVPVFADVQASGSSILPVSTQVALTSSTSGIVDTRPLQIAQVPASDSQALVPAPDQSVVLTSQDTTQDIKPMVSFEEPPISPVAGPSHGQDNSSSSLMMYMDTSGVPAIAGPSNYQPEKQTSSQQQSTQEIICYPEEVDYVLSAERLEELLVVPKTEDTMEIVPNEEIMSTTSSEDVIGGVSSIKIGPAMTVTSTTDVVFDPDIAPVTEPAPPTFIWYQKPSDETVAVLSGKRKRVFHSTETKLAAISRLDNGEPIANVALELGVGINTLRDWRKHREMFKINLARIPKLEVLDISLWSWYKNGKKVGDNVSGLALKEKALELYRQLVEDEEFVSVDGWICLWKLRHRIPTFDSSGGRKEDTPDYKLL